MYILRLARAVVGILPRDFPGRWRAESLLLSNVGKEWIPSIATLRTREGFKVTLDTSDYIQRVIYLLYEWEPHISDIIRGTLRKDDVFVDIGANIGYHSLTAARMVGSAGRVLAFEPNPGNFARLKANVRLNSLDNVECIALAVGRQKGTGKLYADSSGNAGASSMREVGKLDQSIDVEINSLDNVLAHDRADRIRLIKMDIEGAEFEALQGMEQLLSSDESPDVICEVSEWSLQRFGHAKGDVFSIMERNHYDARIISPIRQSRAAPHPGYFQFDVLFRKRRGAVRGRT